VREEDNKEEMVGKQAKNNASVILRNEETLRRWQG